MNSVTWSELIQLAILIVSIITCYFGNKKTTAVILIVFGRKQPSSVFPHTYIIEQTF